MYEVEFEVKFSAHSITQPGVVLKENFDFKGIYNRDSLFKKYRQSKSEKVIKKRTGPSRL